MGFDSFDQVLKTLIEDYALAANDQVVEVLPMVCVNRQTGVNVFVHEDIIKDRQIRQSAVPRAVLKNGGLRSTDAIDDYLGRLGRGKARSLDDAGRLAGREGAQDGRKGGLTTPVLRVYQRQPLEPEVAGIHVVELAHASHKADVVDHGFPLFSG